LARQSTIGPDKATAVRFAVCIFRLVVSGSRGKKNRRHRAELERFARDELQALTDLGQTFDGDSEKRYAARDLAKHLRVLLHQTTRSHALLAQLGELDTLKFRDTVPHPQPGEIPLALYGLIVAGTDFETASYDARCTVGADRDNPDLPFTDWWNAIALTDAQGNTWSRKTIVTILANEEGGAHVDPDQSESVRAVEHANSMGWWLTNSTRTHAPPSGPLLPAVRQIAHEVEITLRRRGY
jgi:hypothetical protein